GTLGLEPWPGTTALYVADVTMVAPAVIGRWSWTISFQQESGALPPHSAFVTPCNLTTERVPDHSVTVTVSDRQNGTALANADVRVGPYRQKTNYRGVAVLAVPAGAYELTAWKSGYEDVCARAIDVYNNVAVTLEMIALDVSSSSDDERVWM